MNNEDLRKDLKLINKYLSESINVYEDESEAKWTDNWKKLLWNANRVLRATERLVGEHEVLDLGKSTDLENEIDKIIKRFEAIKDKL